jgi:hypothetical protein
LKALWGYKILLEILLEILLSVSFSNFLLFVLETNQGRIFYEYTEQVLLMVLYEDAIA